LAYQPALEFRDHLDYREIITAHEINDQRGFRELYEKHELPEFQHLDLTKSYEGYIVEEIGLGDCYEQRKTYPYMYKMGGMQGRKLMTRIITQRERLPYRVENLKTKNNRKLYVTLRCAICGTQKRITVTPRNEGRETPTCKHLNTHRAESKAQPFFIKSVKREKRAVKN